MFSITINGTFTATVNCESQPGMTDEEADTALKNAIAAQVDGLRQQGADYLGVLTTTFDTGLTLDPAPSLGATISSSVSGDSQV